MLPNAVSLLALPMIAFLPRFDLPIAVTLSAAVSFAIAFLSYRVALQNEEKFLAKGQI
ncbi:MAG: hypothetical protein ACUVQ8_03595 [Nitrososphaeria archaeon]